MIAPPDYDPHAFPPFGVTVDVVVFTVAGGQLKVALIERGGPPFESARALPGGFVRPNEDLVSAAARELSEETGLDSPASHLEQFGTYGSPDRDPRMRVVTVGYWAIVPDLPTPKAGTDAAAARLVPVAEALSSPDRLAFDHHEILTDALARARRALETTTVATRFCPTEFTIADLRGVYMAVWGRSLDPGNFQNKVTDITGFVVPTGERREGSRGRPPELYRAGHAKTIEPPLRRPPA